MCYLHFPNIDTIEVTFKIVNSTSGLEVWFTKGILRQQLTLLLPACFSAVLPNYRILVLWCISTWQIINILS